MEILIVLPAIVAVVCILLAIAIGRDLHRRTSRRRTASWIAIACLGAVALGIGSCYGALFLGLRSMR